MADRQTLSLIFKQILSNNNVYYDPPENLKLQYPCIIYSHASNWQKHADDIKYLSKKCYTVTVIDKLPDSSLSEAVNNLPYCSFDREYAADNLHHYVYTLFY